MAYINQEQKAELAPAIKRILKDNNLKGSLSINHHSTLILTIREGKLFKVVDGSHKNIWVQSGVKFADHPNQFNNLDLKFNKTKERPVVVRDDDDKGVWVENYGNDEADDPVDVKVLKELADALNEGNIDKSDSQTDYFHVGWWVQINIGRSEKPYRHVA